MPEITTVLLAGGAGTRIRSLYPNVPKPMIEVRGRPFLEWLTTYLASKGLDDFIYSTGYLSEQIETWCDNSALPGVSRQACKEETPLGTGGGLINCLDQCKDWLLVGNGDCFCLQGLEEMIAFAGNEHIDGAILGVHKNDTSRYGSLGISDEDTLTGFFEKKPGSGYSNAGFYLFRKDALQAFAKDTVLSIETDLFPKMIAEGRKFKVIQVPDAPFIDIGTPETIALLDGFIEEHHKEFSAPGK